MPWTYYAWLVSMALLGSAIREVVAVLGRTNNETPSWARYWSVPRNRWNVLLNLLCTAALLAMHGELVDLSEFAYPRAIALLTGFAGASLFRAITNLVGARFNLPPTDGQP